MFDKYTETTTIGKVVRQSDKERKKKIKKICGIIEKNEIKNLRNELVLYYSGFISTLGIGAGAASCINTSDMKMGMALIFGGSIVLSSVYGSIIVNNHKKIKELKLQKEDKYKKLIATLNFTSNDKLKELDKIPVQKRIIRK